MFVLRFPKGQNISYDPTVDLSPVKQELLPSALDKNDEVPTKVEEVPTKDEEKPTKDKATKESGSSSIASTILPVALCGLLTRLFRP